MAHRWQHSHVPKFGNWDTDNIPYTVYFDNARNKRALINPNDPEENPGAFNLYIRGVEKNDEAVKASTRMQSYSTSSLEQISHEEGRSNTRSHSHHTSKGTQGSYAAESASERSNSDYSVIQRVKSNLRKSMSVGGSFIGSFCSSNHIKRRGGNHSLNDYVNHEAALVPEFGAWDVTDPKSGEGYTAIFSEIRKEKQIASRRVPSKTPSPNNFSNIQNRCSVLSKKE
ncbi:RPM1-interacting protein 4 [Spatholobus suberectus]|nr:RPM1-interacting protein 4 [Spatholobus suberectus]